MKPLLISILRYLHHLILLFIIFGCLLSFPIMLKIHFIFIPLVILQWKLNKGTCILTNMEHALKGEDAGQVVSDTEKEAQQGRFIKSILSKCFDPLPSDKKIEIGIYLVMLTSAAISLIRICCF